MPGERPGDRPRRRPPPRKSGDGVDEDEDLLDEDLASEDEGLPEEVRRKRREGREVAPKGKDEKGQIIDIVA